jgi:transposase
LPSPDGRKSRARLKSLTLPEKLADTVKALMDQGLLLQEIASHLGCVHNTVTKAVKHWHRSRGLPVPDGRTRRKELNWKTSDPSKRMERQADSIQPKDDGTVRAAEQEESSDRS